jgi:hypothetical protein
VSVRAGLTRALAASEGLGTAEVCGVLQRLWTAGVSSASAADAGETPAVHARAYSTSAVCSSSAGASPRALIW